MPHSVSHAYPHVKQNLPLSFMGANFMIPPMALGDQIRRARLANGLSQQAVAAKFEISRAAVAQWENGTTRPDQDKLVVLADLLGIGLDELLSDGQRAADGTRPPAPTLPDDIAAAWDYLLPSECAELEADIKRRAAHNKEAGERAAAKLAEAKPAPKMPATAVSAGPPGANRRKSDVNRRKTS